MAPKTSENKCGKSIWEQKSACVLKVKDEGILELMRVKPNIKTELHIQKYKLQKRQLCV